MNRKLLLLSFISSICVLALSILAIGFKTSIFNYVVSKNVRLVPGTFIYDNWLNLPIKLRTNFYLFNLVNPNEFIKGKEPIFKEIGPFVYDEFRTKENLTLNKNGTISYKERRRFYFAPDLSIHNDDVNVTSINMVIVVVINLVRNTPLLALKPIQMLIDFLLKMNKESIVVTKPVKELLFGYEDELLEMLSKLSIVPSGKISFFYNKNDTIDGEYTIYDGVTDQNKVGEIENYNGKNNLSLWSSSFANQINGTDSTVNFPFLNKSSTPYTYQPDTCRSFYSVFNETAKTYHDIEMYGYILNEYFWANTSVNHDNKGFCTPNCLVSGIFNLTKCTTVGSLEIPTFLSMPHFLFGDEVLLKNIKGLNPNFTTHKSIIYFEPLTGIPMKANKRVQLNTKLNRDENIPMTKNIPEIYFPLFWLDENFEIDKSLGDSFYRMVKVPIILYDVLGYIFIAIGGIVGSFCLYATFYKRNKTLKVYEYSQIGTVQNEDDQEVNIQNHYLEDSNENTLLI